MMLVTKNLAELCALLIDDIYGELPSRIFATLLSKGRSTIIQLSQNTSLTPRQVRHGLAVLVQNNLIYYYVDKDTKVTTYTANSASAYNLIRVGKILDLIESTYGAAEKDVFQSLLLWGQTTVGQVTAAYDEQIKRQARLAGSTTGNTTNGEGHAEEGGSGAAAINSIDELNGALCRLVESELVEAVSSISFRSPEDTYKDIEEDILKTSFPGGVRGGKGKEEFAALLSRRLREVRDAPTSLKRKLQQNGSSIKRRKLINGSAVNGVHDSGAISHLAPETCIRINHEKCVVELRNQRLVQAVSDLVGESTAEVYAVLLHLLSEKISRCHGDPRIDDEEDQDHYSEGLSVSTTDIFDHLKPTIDVYSGVGRVGMGRTDRKSAERIREHPPQKIIAPPPEAEVDGNASPDEDEGELDLSSDSEPEDLRPNGHNSSAKPASNLNGKKEAKVKFDDSAPPRENRLDQMKQHLLLLSESKQGFVRHCRRGRWTVDFEPLLQHLREAELDTVMEQSVGRDGLRLVRILRDKGKLDEKTLPSIALMTKGDVQKKMLQMQMTGYVDMQEVPRDNNRTASRTIFLYWTDTERCLDRLLDNTYKAMVRCLQRLELHRQQDREVLDIVQREDVRGREKEVMEKRYYDKFVRVTEIQEKLLGHVMRLDDLVGVLRDF